MRAALTPMVFGKRPIPPATVDHRDTRLKGVGSCPAARNLIIANMRAANGSSFGGPMCLVSVKGAKVHAAFSKFD